MSLKISVGKNYSADDFEDIAEINWLRNPFGLQAVVEANVLEKHDPTLWDVCNRWSYAEAKNIDRLLFKETIDWYAERFYALEQIYIFFGSERSLKQFIPTAQSITFPARFTVESIAEECHLGRVGSTYGYKNWMRELQKIAEILQNPETEFYCTN
ncbi:MAG: hypothetical protein WA584_23550 [Pyrinomonadaceae bacterium]